MIAFGRRLATSLAMLALPTLARADEPVTMVPHAWQLGMQAAHSPVEANIQDLNYWVTVVIVVISIFVAGLLAYVMWRYDHKRNPVAGTVSHNSTLEAAWTVLPVLILVGIAIPSFRLVYFEGPDARRGHDREGDRASMVLGIYLPRLGRPAFRQLHDRGRPVEAGPIAPFGGG